MPFCSCAERSRGRSCLDLMVSNNISYSGNGSIGQSPSTLCNVTTPCNQTIPCNETQGAPPDATGMCNVTTMCTVEAPCDTSASPGGRRLEEPDGVEDDWTPCLGVMMGTVSWRLPLILMLAQLVCV